MAIDGHTTAQLEALLACACPQKTGNTDLAPGCHAERLLNETSALLFVTPGEPWQLTCRKLIHFGSGYFCRCRQRIDYYKKYGC
ncbi:hypothetical protein [Propionivibrio dicarboxylicus]|nr:hypothetical protein [Propionivibrio dicarboxylicus]